MTERIAHGQATRLALLAAGESKLAAATQEAEPTLPSWRARNARRRVQPVGDDESEESRAEPAPTAVRQEPEEPHYPEESGIRGDGSGERGGSGGGIGSVVATSDADIRRMQDSSSAATRNAYVAEQLKQLARAVGSFPLTAALVGQREQGGDRIGQLQSNASLTFLPQSPAQLLPQQQSAQPAGPTSKAAKSTASSVSQPRRSASIGGEDVADEVDRAAATTIHTTATPHGSGPTPTPRTIGGGLRSPGSVNDETAAGPVLATDLAAGGVAIRSAPPPSPSRARAGDCGAETEAVGSKLTLQEYLVSQLEQLSQLLDAPPQEPGPGPEPGPKPEIAAGGSGAANVSSLFRETSGGYGDEGWSGGLTLSAVAVAGTYGDGFRSWNRSRSKTSNDLGSLQYSASIASSSRSSSPRSLSGAAVAAAAVPVAEDTAEAAQPGSGNERDSDSSGGSSMGASGEEAEKGEESDATSLSTTPSALFSAGKLMATWSSPLTACLGQMAPFEGGGVASTQAAVDGTRSPPADGGGEGKEDERENPILLSTATPVSSISGSANSSLNNDAGSPSPTGLHPGIRIPSAAAVREGDSGNDVENGGSGGDGTGDGPGGLGSMDRLGVGSPRKGSEESGVEGGGRRNGGIQLFTQTFGRAKLWGHMLESESRTRSAIMAGIVAENQGALDQGIVLPCAPSDDEKVLYHETGRCFLVSTGFVSVAALSTGMWLFTVAAPFFYWYAAPTALIMAYLFLSYLGVAVWGENFDPEDHANRLRRARHHHFYPSVDVFLPVCREPTHLLDNTWKHVRALDYPNLSVHVLDDGAKEEVRELAEMHGFNYIRRTNIPELNKAGNLRNAFARTSSEVLAIFDADFCPRPEFLKETTPYFVDRDLAILQTPQFFRHREEQTWVEKGAGVTQELFYRMVQVNRNKFDASICVGTCGVYRREALAPFGGTAAIGYSEDVHTGFNCIQLGYKIKYIPQVMAMGTCPDEPRALFMQQYRWRMGSTTLLCNPDFWGSSLSAKQKLCYLSGMLYYLATALAIFMGPLPALLLIWFKPEAVLWFNISFAVPSMLFGYVGMRYWAKQPYDLCCQRVKVVQRYSHLYALKDKFLNTPLPWVPTGGGASSRSSSKAYESSVRLMLVWNTTYTLLTIGGAGWRLTEFPWYHFLPTILLSIFDFGLHISTLL